jgi:hypothetical protein
MLSSQSVARSMHPWSMTQGRSAGENLVNPGCCLAVVVPVGECGSPSTVAAQPQRATMLRRAMATPSAGSGASGASTWAWPAPRPAAPTRPTDPSAARLRGVAGCEHRRPLRPHRGRGDLSYHTWGTPVQLRGDRLPCQSPATAAAGPRLFKGMGMVRPVKAFAGKAKLCSPPCTGWPSAAAGCSAVSKHQACR